MLECLDMAEQGLDMAEQGLGQRSTCTSGRQVQALQ